MKDHKKKKDSKSIVKEKKYKKNKEKISKITNCPINNATLEAAVRDAILQPRSAIWDKQCRGITRYYKREIPDFSMSDDMRENVKKMYQSRDPDLYDAIEKEIQRQEKE